MIRTVLDADLQPVGSLRPCPETTVAVLGFSEPTRIPCGLLEGHDGLHRYTIEWETREEAEWANAEKAMGS